MTARTCAQCGAEFDRGAYSYCSDCDVKPLCEAPACFEAHVHTYEQRQPILAARRYVRAMRNPVKQAYARDVQRAMCTGHPVPEAPGNLSVMAAQAVRMRLSELLAAR